MRRLLVDDGIGRAWKALDLGKQPRIIGPDIVGLLERDGYELPQVAKMSAGGGSWGGMEIGYQGLLKVDNEETGIPWDADEGFAVRLISIAGHAYSGNVKGPNDDLFRNEWTLNTYLDGASGIVSGEIISRRQLIQFHANYLDGAHGVDGAKPKKVAEYNRTLQLKDVFLKDKQGNEIDGLFFGLLTIGQQVGMASDIQILINEIHDRFPL